MSETMTTTRADRPKQALDAELVSAARLAAHLGCSTAYIRQLRDEGVIEKRGSGYDLDHCRLKYLAHVRAERRRSPRIEADAEHARAKAQWLRLRVAEKEGSLIELDEALETVEKIIGVMLTHLSGLPARIAGHDLPMRRKIDAVIFEIRTAMSAEAEKFAKQHGQPQGVTSASPEEG